MTLNSELELIDALDGSGLFVMKCGGSTLAALPESFLRICEICRRRAFSQ